MAHYHVTIAPRTKSTPSALFKTGPYIIIEPHCPASHSFAQHTNALDAILKHPFSRARSIDTTSDPFLVSSPASCAVLIVISQGFCRPPSKPLWQKF